MEEEPEATAEEEEDVVDPMDTIRETCKKSCGGYQSRLEACNERVESKSETEETCHEEVIDFFHCMDSCSTNPLFRVTK